jgi:hypothetical protein
MLKSYQKFHTRIFRRQFKSKWVETNGNKNKRKNDLVIEKETKNSRHLIYTEKSVAVEHKLLFDLNML